MTCTIVGCDREVRARGWCQKHWTRWKAHGDPEAGVLVLDAGPLLEAFDRRLNARAAWGDRPQIERLLPDGADRRAFNRARRAGRVTECTADRLAVRGLGLTVDEVYGLEAFQGVCA